MKGSFQGTWETSGGGSGGLVVAVVLVLLFGSGAAAAVSAVVIGVLIAAAALLVASAAGLGYLIYRSRRRQADGIPSLGGIVRPPVMYDLGGPQRPALGTPAPRELHQHYHLHVSPGSDLQEAAEIMQQLNGGGAA